MSNEYPLYIYNHMCKIKSDFIVEKSKTFKSKPFEIQYFTNITLSYIIEDQIQFTFNETNTKKYIQPILYHYRPYNNVKIHKENKSAYTCAYIGLKIPKYNSRYYSQSLILQLKNLRVISNHCFFILYNNDNEDGKIIIGEYPHIYDSYKYKSYQFKKIYGLDLTSYYNWYLKFNCVYLEIKNSKIILNNFDSIIDNSLGIIFSPEDFINNIYDYFFKEKISKGLCTEKMYDENIKYFICKAFKDIKSFPTLYFQHSILLYTFELNYNDLFKKINDEYIFLIWYKKGDENNWKLGKPFLKKYLLLFNYDEKIIGFYNPLIDIDGNLIEEKNIKEKTLNPNAIAIFIFIIILLLLVFIIFFIIARRFYKKKKNYEIWMKNNKSKIQELIYKG